MASLVENKKSTTLIGLGDFEFLKKLIDKINEEFKSNSKYKNSLNSIDIASTSESDNRLFEIKIDTKYYNLRCELVLVAFESLDALKLNKNEIEGIVVVLSKSTSPLSLANLERLKEFNAGLNLLIWNDLSDEAIKKSLKDEVEKNLSEELIELEFKNNLVEQTSLSGDEDEDEFSELDELINCLLVHNWLNMSLKVTLTENKEARVEAKKPEVAEEVEPTEPEDDDGGGGVCSEFDVESLIANLSEMRTKAGEMSFEERKVYAEKVVMNFWKSIGGDENEIGNLDEDD